MAAKEIKRYDPKSFTARFMPSEELYALLKGNFEQFFILRVEEMYRHVQHAVPPSRATNHTCIFLTEGTAQIKIGSTSCTIHRHEMLFVPAGQVFSFDEHDVNKGYLCAFHDELLQGKYGNKVLWHEFEFLKVWGEYKIQPGQQSAGFILHLLRRLLAEYRVNGLERPDIICSNLVAMLCEVKACYAAARTEASTAAQQISRGFRELVFTRSKELHRVSDYAALLHISPNHLNKAVKSVSGKTPIQWIDEALVQEARMLLWQTSMTVNEIADVLGFDDSSYFARLFRKCTGLSPSAYRNGLKSAD